MIPFTLAIGGAILTFIIGGVVGAAIMAVFGINAPGDQS